MKKYLLTSLAVLAAFSCSKEESLKVEPERQPLQFAFSVAQMPSFDAATKAIKTGWEDGDKIYIVFDDVVPESLEDFLIMQYDGAEWVVTQEGTVSPQTDGGTLDALYYENPDPQTAYELNSADGGNFYFETDEEFFGKYFYLCGNNIAYTVVDSQVEAVISLDFQPNNVRTYVQFRVTGIEGDWSFVLDDNDDIHMICWNPIWQEFNHCFNYTNSQLVEQPMDSRADGQYLFLSVKQMADDITITLHNTSGEHAGYYLKTFSKKISGKSAAVTFKGPQFDETGTPTNGWLMYDINGGDGEYMGHRYVDLGGDCLWATMNVGAEDVSETGDFFAWGEVEPYYSSLSPLTWKDGKEAGYTEVSYKYWDAETSTYTTYTTNMTTLESEDDAATVNWGGNWRTPTYDELKWLKNNCTWTALGDTGLKITSNVSGFEDKFIILSKGYFEDTNYTEEYGYWTATSYYYNSDYVGAYGLYSKSPYMIPRYWGMAVRPVFSREE